MVESKTSAKEGNSGLKMAKITSTRGLDLIIGTAITLVFFLSPIFFTGLVAQGIGFEKMILFYFLVLVGIVAWVTRGVITGELNIKRTPLDLPILAILAIFTVSTILSVSTRDSLIGSYGGSAKGLVSLFVFVLFFYLVINNINAKRIRNIFWALVASTSLLIVYSLLQLAQIYILPMAFTHARAFNPLGSLSGLTMYLVSVLPLLVVAATQTREIISKPGPLAIVVKVAVSLVILGGLIVLALLNGFTFWPIAIVGLVIVLMFLLAKIIKVTSNNLIIPLAVFLALIILLVLGNFNIVNLQLPAEISLSRGASWSIAKASLGENPIFGSGPGTFYYTFSKFKSPSFNATPLWNVRFDSATGTFFELMATVGALGVVAIAVLGLIALSIAFLTLIKSTNREVNSILLALFASFISILLYSNLFTVNNSFILLAVIISILTVAASLVMYPERFRDLKLSFRASPKFALALAAIFLFVSAGVVVLFTMGLKMYLADIYARQAIDAASAQTKIDKLNQAIALAPYQDKYYLTLANVYMGEANQAALNGGNQTAVGSDLSQAIDNGKRAVDISANSASNNEQLALIYENASFYTRGALEWAEQLYHKVNELDPQNPTPSLRIALVNMARSNAETDPEEQKYYINEAIKSYDDAIAKKGDLAAAYYGKAIADEKLNDIDQAIEELRRAVLVAGNNLDYRFELGRLYFNRGVSQPKIDQNAFEKISENDITPGNENSTTTEDTISVTPTQPAGAVVSMNDDLKLAEQLFLSIIAANPNHANALYSLAVLYKKTGETENAKVAAENLLKILKDQQSIDAVRQQFADILGE